eukprot:TRINITY_DN999_c0_g1_i1.p1 TRINITY_DN999_c0_g1~~TRINITY_DN999_c0_g1_i1.p1  ORF type:complete len:949 (-),score=220.13 TRINITY_DN999_c0_g1_i1:2127-4973(-)
MQEKGQMKKTRVLLSYSIDMLMHRNVSGNRKKPGNKTAGQPSRQDGRVLPSMRRADQNDLDLSGMPDGSIHLLLDVKACMVKLDAASELYFSLYSPSRKSFITEEYCVRYVKSGVPEHDHLINRFKVVFEGLSKSDFNAKLFLVCRIYSKHKEVSGEKEKKEPLSRHMTLSQKRWPRVVDHLLPFACSYLSLSEQSMMDHLLTWREVVPKESMSLFRTSNSNNFHNFHEVLTSDHTLEKDSTHIGIAVGLRLLRGNLGHILSESKLVGIPIVPKQSFGDIVHPRDSRSSFYVTLNSGNFEVKNIEVRVFCVHSYQGSEEIVEGCLLRGHAPLRHASDSYTSTVVLGALNPRWNETILLEMDKVSPECTTIVFAFYSGSIMKDGSLATFEPIGVSILPLTLPEGAIIADERRSLPVYKLPGEIESFKLKNIETRERVKKAVFSVSTKLVSTKVTQDTRVHKLLHWRSVDKSASLAPVLKSVTYCDDQNVLARFMLPIFTSLFDILAERPQAADDVYLTLCWVVKRAKMDKVKEVADYLMNEMRMYIDEIMTSTSAHVPIMKSLILTMESAVQRGILDSISNNALEVLEFLFAIARKSFQNHLEKFSSGIEVESAMFRKSVLSFFSVFCNFLACDKKVMSAGQERVLPQCAHVMRSVDVIFDFEMQARIGRDLLSSVRVDLDLVNYKKNVYNFLSDFVRLPMFIHRDSHFIVFPVVMKFLQKILRIRGASEGIVDVVANVLDVVYRSRSKEGQDVDDTAEDTKGEEGGEASVSKKLLRVVPLSREQLDSQLDFIVPLLFELLRFTPKNLQCLDLDHGVFSMEWKTNTRLISCILTLLHIIPQENIVSFVVKEESKVLDRIDLIISFAELILEQNPFPQTWTTMSMLCYTSILNILRFCCEPIAVYERNHGIFGVERWSRYFKLCISFIKANRLELESMKPGGATYSVALV